MLSVQRYDRSRIPPKVRHLGAGGLLIPASIARSGVQEYSNGTETWGEYRPAEEVFHPVALATLAHVPVTIAHEGGMVDPGSWRTLAHGHVDGRAKVKDGWIFSSVVLNSADAISRVDRHELVEISAGYGCKLEEKPGYHNGKPYRYVQREIRYNHVSLLPPGHARAGSDARLRLDSKAPPHHFGVSLLKEPQMKIFRIDAKKATATLGEHNYNLTEPKEVQAASKELNRLITARVDGLEPAELMARINELQAMAVSLVDAVAALSAELSAEADAPVEATLEEVEEMIGVEAMDSRVSERAEILSVGAAFGLETKGKKSLEIMREVLDSRGINVEGAPAKGPGSIADLYKRFPTPTETFDSRTASIVKSGPAGGSDNEIDKALAENREKRGSAWKTNRGDK